MASNTAIYVYCLVRAGRRPATARLPEPLPRATAPQLTAAGAGLFLVTSEVPLDTYDPAQLEPRLRDLDWVSDIALAHERVVQHFARKSGATVIPMKMFTMFSSLDKALADVRGRRRAIDRQMKRIAGCEEWGIRIARVPGSVPATPATRGSGRARPASSGTAFLTARKVARDDATAAKSAARTAAVAAFTRLERFSRDAWRRPERREPGSNPPILEAAFLVTARARDRFRSEARRQAASCAAAGAEMVLTGPWAPYNFVGPAEDSA